MAGAALTVPPWQQVVGQTRIRTQLAESLRTGRGAHALLFAGPPGIGKGAVALEYAALLFCEQDGLTPCGECPPCHAMARLEHPDLHLIFPLPAVKKSGDKNGDGETSSADDDPALAVAERVAALTAKLAHDPYTMIVLPKVKRQKDEPKDKDAKEKSESRIIRIAQVRALIRQASLKPFLGARKVFVVFAADTMNPDAQNAFLKVLEDPGSESCFVLITDSERELLPTIRSRCQKIAFPALTREEIQGGLQRGGVSPDRAEAAAALSGGRLVRAREMAGGDLPRLQVAVIDYLRAAAVCDPAKIMEQSAKLMETGDLPRETALELLSLFLRDAAVARAGDGATGALTFAGFEDTLTKLMHSYPAADLEAAARLVDESADYLTRGYTQDLVLYTLAIRLHETLGPMVPSKPKPQTRHA